MELGDLKMSESEPKESKEYSKKKMQEIMEELTEKISKLATVTSPLLPQEYAKNKTIEGIKQKLEVICKDMEQTDKKVEKLRNKLLTEI